jgi:hypothetical protein
MHGGRGCSSKGDSWMHPDATASRWRESERHGIHLGVFGCSSRGESLGGRKRTYQTLVEEQPASSNTSELLTHPVTVGGGGRVHISLSHVPSMGVWTRPSNTERAKEEVEG